MLHTFLVENREAILSLTRRMTAGISEERPTSDKSEQGLPQFYDYLVTELQREKKGLPKHEKAGRASISTAAHGKELSRLGYTVTQVVRGYGVICQAITELAQDLGTPIDPNEFRALNLCLDDAIADAVKGFADNSRAEASEDSAKRLGFLVHELRNILTAAMVAHSMIKKGIVEPGGRTNEVLERNLYRMRDILDRSFTAIRMRSDKIVERRPVSLLEIAGEVEATAHEQARARGLKLVIDVDPKLTVIGDHNYLLSALSNLVQNGIKYSNHGGIIRVRGRDVEHNVIIEVEDHCGGLPPGTAEELFRPFTQKSSDRTGLGLGLTISRQAVALNGGTLSVHDLPGQGCIFTMTLPKVKAHLKDAARSGQEARGRRRARTHGRTVRRTHVAHAVRRNEASVSR